MGRAVSSGACVYCSKRETERINTSEIPDDSIWNGRGYVFDVSNSRERPKRISLLHCTVHDLFNLGGQNFEPKNNILIYLNFS